MKSFRALVGKEKQIIYASKDFRSLQGAIKTTSDLAGFSNPQTANLPLWIAETLSAQPVGMFHGLASTKVTPAQSDQTTGKLKQQQGSTLSKTMK